MESHNLYRVKEEDLDKLIRILTVCFSEDPLYHALIPDSGYSTVNQGVTMTLDKAATENG